MTKIEDLSLTNNLSDTDLLVTWNGATRAIQAGDAATYFQTKISGNFQPKNTMLTNLAGLGSSGVNNQYIVITGFNTVAAVSGANLLSNIGGQPVDPTLTALAGLTTSAGDYIEATGSDTFRVRKLTVATYAALTAIPAASRHDDMLVYVASRSADGDGGEGYWRFDAGSSATANGGTILAPDAGSGRWLRQYSGAVNVRWFGAKGDGVTDDTAAIQATVNGVVAGTIIFFPKGTYRAISQISINTQNVTFKGEDRTLSIIKFDDGSYTGLKTSTTGIQTGSGFTIIDMYVRGTTNASPAVQLCDFTNNSPYIVIQRSTFGFADVCIRLGETYVVKILDNQMSNCNTAILAVADGSQADCIIRGNTFGTCPDNTDVLLDLQFAGVIVDGNYFETQTRKKPCVVFRTGSQRATLSNNLFQVENGLACQVETSVGVVISGNVIDETYDETNERVIRIDGGADAIITGNRIWPNSATTATGISASGAIVVTGNYIRDCGSVGIVISNGNAVGNTINNSGTGIQASGGAAVGFNRFENNTTDLSIGGSDPTIAALNYASTINEGNAAAAVFANTPRRVALYERYGQTTYDPPSLNDGDGDTTTVTVTGCVLGDFVTDVSFSLDLQGINVHAWVSAADTVSVRFQNETGGTLNLGSGTLRVITRKGS